MQFMYANVFVCYCCFDRGWVNAAPPASYDAYSANSGGVRPNTGISGTDRYPGRTFHKPAGQLAHTKSTETPCFISVTQNGIHSLLHVLIMSYQNRKYRVGLLVRGHVVYLDCIICILIATIYYNQNENICKLSWNTNW